MRGVMSLLWLVAVAGVFAVASAAPAEYEGTSFSQVLNSAYGVSASTSADYYPREHHVCLREYRQRECRTYGCQDRVERCDSGGCSYCRIGDHYTSDMQCCQHHEAYGYYDHQDTVDTNGWMRDQVGGCDWNFMWLRDYSNGNSDNTCGWVEVVRDRVWKVGTATAECNFGHASEHCGEPLCGRTKITLQGTVYATQAYSLADASEFGTNTDFCFDWSDIDSGDCGELAPFRNALRATRNRQAANQTSGSPSTPSSATVQSVQDSYNSGDQPIQAYLGSAIVITGGITSVSGGQKKHKAKWEDGSFQYVPYYWRDNTGIDTVTDDTIPWVRPRTYRFTFEEEENEYYNQGEASLAGGTKN